MDYLADDQQLGSVEADLFYDNMRALVVVFLMFSFLLPLSYVVLACLRNTKESPHYKDDITVHRFVIGSCTFALALNLTMILMLPFSIVANEILVLSPESYYVQWINTALLNALFISVTFGGKVACILLPFCFFLLSSHSVFRGKKAVTSRFIDSSIYLGISYTAFFGSLITISLIISMFSSSPHEESDLFTEVFPQFSLHSFFSCYSWPIRFLGEFLCYFDAALVVVQQIISYVGLFLLLICMPYGIICIIFVTINISTYNAIISPSGISVEKYCLELIDEMYYVKLRKCSLYIEMIHFPYSTVKLPLYDPVSYKLCCSQVSHSDSVFRSSHTVDDLDFTQQISSENTCLTNESRLVANAVAVASGAKSSTCLPLLILFCLAIILLVGAAYTTTNIIVILYGLIFGNNSEPAQPGFASSGSLGYLPDISIGHESASKFGIIGALFQLLLVVFLVFTSIFGFYSLPVIRKCVAPTPRETHLLKVLANCVCLLCLSSALPMQASILGLASPPFPLYAISLTDKFCNATHHACVPSTNFHSHASQIAQSDWHLIFWQPVYEPSTSSSVPSSSHLSIPTSSMVVADESVLTNGDLNVHPSSKDLTCPSSSSETLSNNMQSALQIEDCKEPLKPSSFDSFKNPSKSTPCAYFPTYILPFFYIGFHPRNCKPLMALSYNISFLLTFYWLFKRCLCNCSHILHLKAFLIEFISAFRKLIKPIS